MIKFFKNEKWKEVKLHKSLQRRYAVSNHGRLMSFEKKFADGRLLAGGDIEGYKVFPHSIRNKHGETKHRTLFIHKIVAEYFVKQKSKDHNCVIHLDHNNGNNLIKNLKWVTKKEMVEHNKKSPNVIKARKKLIAHNIKSDGRKLTVVRATEIKKRILNPNRKTTLKQIAKQFGISEMHVYRIKSGENWGHIKVK